MQTVPLTFAAGAHVPLLRYLANFSKASSMTYEIDLSHIGRENSFRIRWISSSAIVPRADAVTEACERLCLELWRPFVENNHVVYRREGIDIISEVFTRIGLGVKSYI